LIVKPRLKELPFSSQFHVSESGISRVRLIFREDLERTARFILAYCKGGNAILLAFLSMAFSLWFVFGLLLLIFHVPCDDVLELRYLIFF